MRRRKYIIQDEYGNEIHRYVHPDGIMGTTHETPQNRF